MNLQEVQSRLIAAITMIQTQSGRGAVGIENTTIPFKDLDGFDSLNGEEVLALLSEEFEFDSDFDPFVDDSGCERSVEQIAVAMSQECKLRVVPQ